MSRGISYIVCLHIFLSTALTTTSQVNVKASTDRNLILIGEPIILTINVYYPLGIPVNLKIPDSIPHFEYLQKLHADTVETIDGKKITQVFKITSFDSGQWELPPFQFTAANKTYASDTLMINVAFTSDEPPANYRDIKDIEEVKDPVLQYIPWIIGMATVLSIAGLVLMLRKKRPPLVEVRITLPALAPYEEAMRALDDLKKKGWPENGEVKVYYTQLNHILRQFLQRKMNIRSLEKTNEEILVDLATVGIPRDTYIQIAQALRLSDFVKFAKYQPGLQENKQHYHIIETAIRIVNNID